MLLVKVVTRLNLKQNCMEKATLVISIKKEYSLDIENSDSS